MNIVETILVFVGIPLAIYGVCALATLRSKLAGSPRYRPGQPWEYPPMWWSAHPDGVAQPAAAEGPSPSKDRGGARGNW
ncbi:hypothetical protein B0I33_104538 [Prauserella shujinwangii]|uniref:Uncharacterized protein n=1 Tax=Prauserella shujinwangii TaxID=1453103 RepID=A0A2T0LXG6_9PSEU|nr:hypothetical protein [Prauserella shujinwangii]PRX48720.1 hypothetical protein B0I33_104538 [Prauserella shujinwangii]